MTRHARRQLGSGLESGIGDSHGWNVAPLQARSPNISIPSPIPESPQEYTSFTGTPVFSSNPFPSDSGVDSDDMEATVADLIYGHPTTNRTSEQLAQYQIGLITIVQASRLELLRSITTPSLPR